jgi:hypothetical protein
MRTVEVRSMITEVSLMARRLANGVAVVAVSSCG